MGALLNFANQASALILDLDPEGKAKLTALVGKTICLQITAPVLTLYLQPTRHGLSISEQLDADADATLTGPLSAFVRLGLGGAESGVLSSGKISMQGDVDIGQSFQKAFAQLDLDWEEVIAQLIGDTPARKTGNLIRHFGSWIKQSKDLSTENMADYLTEEIQLIPSSVSVQRFRSRLDVFRSDVDRTEQKLDQLKRKVQSFVSDSR
jgi:ubiquinone biosynthesis protein UbiJ